VKYVFLETIFFFYFFLGLELVKFEDRSIVLKPADPVGRSGGSIRDPVYLELEPGRVEKKTREGKTRCDPTRPDCKPVDLFFLLK